MTRLLKDRQRGMLDVSYVAYFPLYQKPVIQDLIHEINTDHDPILIEKLANVFDSKIKQITYNDQVIQASEIISNGGDMLVLGGINRMIDCMRGASSPFQYLATGTEGGATITLNDNSLLNEAPGRINMSDANVGWREQYGMKLFYGGIHSETTGNNLVGELGIFTSSSGGTMLNHSGFGTALMNRSLNPQSTMYRQIMIFAVFVEFCPALP